MKRRCVIACPLEIILFFVKPAFPEKVQVLEVVVKAQVVFFAAFPCFFGSIAARGLFRF